MSFYTTWRPLVGDTVLPNSLESIQAVANGEPAGITCTRTSTDLRLWWYFTPFNDLDNEVLVYDTEDDDIVPPDTNVWRVEFDAEGE